MNQDKVLWVYPVAGGHAALTSGGPTFTGQAAFMQGAHECLVTLAYEVPDDVGITFTWGLEWSADGATGWTAIAETTNEITLAANAGVSTSVYGFIENLQKYTSGGFLRVVGLADNFTNDTIQVYCWLNMGRGNEPIMHTTFRPLFAFDVKDAN